MDRARLEQVVAAVAARAAAETPHADKITWLGSLTVGDVMSSPPVCTDPGSSVTSAHLLMREHNIRRLPVLADRRLVGILTLGDVRGALPSEVSTLNRSELQYLSEQLKVERAMTRQVVSVTPSTSLKDAARVMYQHKIGGLPVVSPAGEVVGMLTESDIFRTVVALLELDASTAAPGKS